MEDPKNDDDGSQESPDLQSEDTSPFRLNPDDDSGMRDGRGSAK